MNLDIVEYYCSPGQQWQIQSYFGSNGQIGLLQCHVIVQKVQKLQLMMLAPNILPPLTSNAIALLSDKSPSASCTFHIQDKLCFQGQNSMESHNYNCLQLQIIQGFIVHLSSNKSIISGLLPKLQHKFQVLHQNYFGEQIAIGLAFEGPTFSKRLILIAKQRDKLTNFLNMLKGLNIIELGFEKDRFEPLRRIGEGANAKVYEAIEIESKKRVAIRCFRKKKVFQNGQYKKSFYSQVQIMKSLKGQGFPELKGIYESQQSIYMVMELFTRNLKAHIQRYGFPQLPQCKYLMLRLAKSVNHLHQKNLMHRDIKLQNIMIGDEGPDPKNPIIVDFGLAIKGDAPASTQIAGTPGYIAPQIFQHTGYTKRCDIFSLGVLFHFILLGQMVFLGSNEREVMILNRNGAIDYLFSRHPMIPQSMRSLLGGMLQKIPHRRLSINEVIEHPFFKDN